MPQQRRSDERVVLVDEAGRSLGTADKATVHGADTPLHLGFSCYVFDERGALLLTRRADGKATFGGVWTNSFCGHPAPAEALADAVRRRAGDELGLALSVVDVVLPAFRYRAEMSGIVENELCPVVLARVAVRPLLDPDPAEVSACEWVDWHDVLADVSAGRRTVSPWCAEQLPLLTALGADPASWASGDRDLLPAAIRPLA